MTDPLTAGQQGIADELTQMFTDYGLGTLAPQILNFVQQGYDAPTTQYMLSQTDAYKQRFAGNEIRRQQGLPVLSPAEYLQLESSYKSISQAYNLPANFYDNPSDFANLIGKNISPTEYERRAAYAFKYTQASNPDAKNLLQQYYGINDSHIMASFLDPDKAQAIIDRQSAAVDIGVEAARQGIAESKARAEGFADQGISTAQAAQGYQNTALALQEGQLDIAKRFGSDLTANDISDEMVGGLASAKRKRDQLNEQETNLFAQNEGAASHSFAQDNFGSY